jgi:hypothetical protein
VSSSLGIRRETRNETARDAEITSPFEVGSRPDIMESLRVFDLVSVSFEFRFGACVLSWVEILYVMGKSPSASD